MKRSQLVIISGGQTGVDQNALFVAGEFSVRTGGIAPAGYRTDHGPAPWLRTWNVTEHVSPLYPPRTLANVLGSNATAIFGNAQSPGCRLTARYCHEHSVPCLVNPSATALLVTMREHLERTGASTFVLNVAGNRARTNPDASALARSILREFLSRLQES